MANGNQPKQTTQQQLQQQQLQQIQLQNQLKQAQIAQAQAQAEATKFSTPSLALKEDIKSGIEIATEQGFKDLGRLGESADIQAALDVRRKQLSGLTGAEQQAQRDVALRNINRATEGSRRQLAATQARLGVRGAIAASQQQQAADVGAQRKADFERDLFLRQRAAEGQAAGELLRAASGVETFDIAQEAKEKKTLLQTGLGVAGIASAERSGQRQAEATAASGGGGGGGGGK